MGDNYSYNNYRLQIYQELWILSIYSWTSRQNTKMENHMESPN